MANYSNQFTDSFKYLTSAAKSVKDLSTQVTGVLNRILPSRILSKANIFNMSIDVSVDLSKLIMLHVEDSLIEQNMLIAQKETSIRGLATLTGHSAVRPISSTGVIKLSLKTSLQLLTPTLVLNDVIFRCMSNNLNYLVTTSIQSIATSTETLFLSIIEGSYITNQYIAQGDKLETIYLDDNSAIEQSNILVHVNGIQWSVASALYDMTAGQQSYILKNGIGNQVDIIFGDGVYGKRLTAGDVIVIKHLVTAGEEGNVPHDAQFKLVSGIYNSEGIQIDISDYITIAIEQGFQLGSNGENIETTRLIAGYNSRALTFIRPENLKAYLSRLSILSLIDVWTDQDDNVFNLMLLPNIRTKLNTWSDYFSIALDKLVLTDMQKASIIEYINTSGQQITSSELLIVEPIFEKYAMFIYINANSVNKQTLKSQIESAVAEQFLLSTFLDNDMTNQGIISQTAILESIWSIDNINQANIDIVSERNELARINGSYDTTEIIWVGATKQIITKTVTVSPTDNPNLGFDELGSVSTGSHNSIPLLRGGFRRYNSDSEPILLDKPVYIFYKTINGFEEL